MKFKLIRSYLQCGEKIPFYYGLGKRSPYMGCDFLYIIPINFIVRFLERLRLVWFALLTKSKLWEYQKMIYLDGYDCGYNDATKHIKDDMKLKEDL